MQNDVNQFVIPVLRQYESEYSRDAYAVTLEQVFERLRKSYNNIGDQAKIVSSQFVTNVNTQQKQRFYRAMERAIGVNLSTVVANENLTDTLVAKTRENVSLITSIPDEYFKKIEVAVFEGTTQGNRASSLIKEIQHIGKVTKSRAKLIARDQTSKLNSALVQQRQENLGVVEYIWRTAKDDRVRPSHASKNGKVFRWDNPPKDTGHPGEDINCRCVAQPIIKV